MTKAELVTAIARESGLQKVQAKRALDAFVTCATRELTDGKEVRLVGFGSLVPVRRAARLARNPKTGAPVNSKAFKTARFRIGETLRATLN